MNSNWIISTNAHCKMFHDVCLIPISRAWFLSHFKQFCSSFSHSNRMFFRKISIFLFSSNWNRLRDYYFWQLAHFYLLKHGKQETLESNVSILNNGLSFGAISIQFTKNIYEYKNFPQSQRNFWPWLQQKKNRSKTLTMVCVYFVQRGLNQKKFPEIIILFRMS